LATPGRVERSWRFLTSGYDMDVGEVVNGALFSAEGSEMVVVKGIEFYSVCEHHMLPFFGKAHIGYIPNERLLGLSKFARVVDVFARRLQVQERMTSQIADALVELLQPQGLAVVHDDARSGEAGLEHPHQRDARRVQVGRPDAPGVPRLAGLIARTRLRSWPGSCSPRAARRGRGF
jgi:GTP cyclohydrolase I